MKKQIEEMAEVIDEFTEPLSARDIHKSEFSERFAEHLYTAGYRKQSEGEWVLHKPRMKNRNATYKCSNCGKLCSSYYNDVGEWKRCPHCFAKMKGGADK